VAAGYIPDARGIVWLNFSPQAGRKQAGHCPAAVLKPWREHPRLTSND
jgi:mRNA-degrading endonuclease toxin of MazEF toxin-antitoxin module